MFLGVVAVVLGVVVVAVVAVSLFGSDPEPPRREVPVVASALPSNPAPAAPRDQEPDALCCRPRHAARTVPARSPARSPAPFVETAVRSGATPRVEDLYAAYVRAVETLTDLPFRENVGDCSASRSEGEVSWSLNRTIRAATSPCGCSAIGLSGPDDRGRGAGSSARRRARSSRSWTQDPFRLVAATGSPAHGSPSGGRRGHMQLACADEPSDLLP